MKRFVAVVVVLLAGCTTTAEREYERIGKVAETTSANERVCWRKVYNSPDYAALSGYLPAFGSASPPSPTILANNEAPTPEQSATLVRLYNNDIRPCQEQTLTGAQTMHPRAAQAFREIYSLGDLGYSKLAARQMTWGQYAEFYALLQTGGRQLLAKTVDSIKRDLSTAHTAEVNQRQAAFANLSNVGNQLTIMGQNQQMINQNQQMINQMNRPVTTNCRYVGRQLVCNSF